MTAYRKYARRRIKSSISRKKLATAHIPKFSDFDYSRFLKNPKRPAPSVRTKRATRGPVRRGSLSQQEGSMVYSLRPRRSRRHARRARRNPRSMLDILQHPRFSRGKKRASKRRSHRRSRRIRLGAHRPVVIRTAHAWRRPKRSKLFRRATRINPRRSRRHGRRSYRRNPFSLPRLPFNLQNVAFGGLKIAGGIAIGMLGMPLIVKHIAPMVDKTGQYRKFYGLVHVVLGAVAASMIKKQIVREVALTVAGVGVYDLITQNLPMLGLPKIGLAGDMDQPGVIGVDMEPALMGASYQSALGASYGTDDIAYGSDNDSLDC